MNNIDPKKELPTENSFITFVTKEPEAYAGVYKDGRFLNLTKKKDNPEDFTGFEVDEIDYWIKNKL